MAPIETLRCVGRAEVGASVNRRLAVWGSPIAHSRSPQIHRAAYAELGLDWQYSSHECGRERLAAELAELDNTWCGLSLTMPLKEVAITSGEALFHVVHR